MFKTAVIIPTLNGGGKIKHLFASINDQSYQPHKKLLIDSESTDRIIEEAKEYGFEIMGIKRSDFNHGATRQMGVNLVPDADIVLFLTQDAILGDPKSLDNLLHSFSDPEVGAAYGRQLPHQNARLLETHARLFNYPPASRIKSLADASNLGIKTPFISNSFAAYRRSALMSVGGFPNNTILGEDTYVAAKMLLNGWKIKYCAEAPVYHSHNYNCLEEFRRYFDIGVFHSREPWIRKSFGQAEGEGTRFLKSEVSYLSKKDFLQIPSAIFRTFVKLLGYKMGMQERKIPTWIKIKLSMHQRYWMK
jgi:rhamnosyltransferase